MASPGKEKWNGFPISIFWGFGVVGRVFSVFHLFARGGVNDLCTRVLRYPQPPSAKLSRDTQRARASVAQRRCERDSPLHSSRVAEMSSRGFIGEKRDGGRRLEGGEWKIQA